MKHTFKFDPEKHEYRIDDRIVPSVTQILKDTVGLDVESDEWHMNRGTAVHACYGFIARGIAFDCDPECEPFVAACKDFLGNIRHPTLAVEQHFYSIKYQYAGTPDLIVGEMKSAVVIDYKTSIGKRVPLQLAGYAILLEENGFKVAGGLCVAIPGDGTFKTSKLFDLKQERREFLALRSAWGIKQKYGG